jgi:hypothetical protein
VSVFGARRDPVRTKVLCGVGKSRVDRDYVDLARSDFFAQLLHCHIGVVVGRVRADLIVFD